MGDQFKLDKDGNCPTCGKLSVQGEHIQCYTCCDHFHAVCSAASPDDKVATKTTVSQFLLTSTKRNFVFYCDKCLTELEIRKAESESQRVDILEKKMNGIDSQLGAIMKLLSEQSKTQETMQHGKKNGDTNGESIWFDKERLATIKAPEPKAVLVVGKSQDSEKETENHDIIEKAVMENHIPLSETYENKSGDLVIVCESKDARDKLKTVVENSHQDIVLSSPKIKKKPITIVGLPKAHKEEEIIGLILRQNEFMKNFAMANKIEEHLVVHVVKPLRNKHDVFQVFASVSPILREGISRYSNKIMISLKSCKVYDRSQTKRCNNCQHFGHFAKDCPTPEEPYCGNCGMNHRSDQCPNKDQKKCINCVRKQVTDSTHSAFDHKCPTFLENEQHLTQRSLNQREHYQTNPT